MKGVVDKTDYVEKIVISQKLSSRQKIVISHHDKKYG